MNLTLSTAFDFSSSFSSRLNALFFGPSAGSFLGSVCKNVVKAKSGIWWNSEIQRSENVKIKIEFWPKSPTVTLFLGFGFGAPSLRLLHRNNSEGSHNLNSVVFLHESFFLLLHTTTIFLYGLFTLDYYSGYPANRLPRLPLIRISASVARLLEIKFITE